MRCPASQQPGVGVAAADKGSNKTGSWMQESSMSQTRINGDTANNTLHFYYLDYFKLTFAVYQEADSEFLCSFSIRLDIRFNLPSFAVWWDYSSIFDKEAIKILEIYLGM